MILKSMRIEEISWSGVRRETDKKISRKEAGMMKCRLLLDEWGVLWYNFLSVEIK